MRGDLGKGEKEGHSHALSRMVRGLADSFILTRQSESIEAKQISSEAGVVSGQSDVEFLPFEQRQWEFESNKGLKCVQ